MPEAEFVTVAEASERWNVPARRVRHVLERSAKHSANAPQTQQKTFRTKTGERSAVAYPADWLGALLEGEATTGKTFQRSEGERFANEAKQSAEPFQHSAPDRSEGEDWRARALVAEAERDGLTARLADAQKAAADTASDRDAWKEQAGALTEALRAAQDEARAARLIGGRAVQQIEASGLAVGDSGASEASGGVIDRPEAVRAPWWAFWKARG